MKILQVALALLLLPSSTEARRRGGPRTKAMEEQHRVHGKRRKAVKESKRLRGKMFVPEAAKKKEAERAAVSAHRTKVKSDSELGEDNSASYDDSCANDPPHWHDSDGPKFTCDWYAEYPQYRCVTYGDGYENFGKTANEACCVCGEDHGADGEDDLISDYSYEYYEYEYSNLVCDGQPPENYCDCGGDCTANPDWCACEEAQACCEGAAPTLVCDGQPPENYCDCSYDCFANADWCACEEAQECCESAHEYYDKVKTNSEMGALAAEK